MRTLNLTLYTALILTAALLSACASPAVKSFRAAEELESEGKYEEAMYKYADSFKHDPTVNETRIRFLKTRQVAADSHYRYGLQLVEQGNHVDALKEFQSAQGIDPTQDRFRQLIEVSTRHKQAQAAYQEGLDFEKGNKLKDAHRQFIKAAELFPKNAEYLAALERITKQRKSKLDGFELKLKSSKPITLKFKDAKMKDVFNILTQLSGINFIFDDGIKDSPITIFLENASFQQALSLLSSMNKLSTKNLNETTVLIYQTSPDKSKQYEDMVTRTFHLNYMDAKKAINLIRTLIQVRKVYVNEDSNSIVVRDAEDVIGVVEKILDANDMPEAEVVLDVEVMEVSDKNAENVGLLLSSYNVQMGGYNAGTPLATSLAGATSSVSTTATSSTSTVTPPTITVNNLVNAFNIKNFGAYVTVPNATFNFGKTLANGEVLSNPKIRVKNKEKAKFNVGTRVPITTTTINGTQSQVNVQYVDVGVKVNAEPTILLNNEISIKMTLEVSSILTKEKVGSDGLTNVVTIGTRNIETVLSLKDNETSVIGGLIQRSNSEDKSKVYLLSDIPLIGNLFTNTNASKDKTELMLAITPRLVRGIPVPLPGLSSFVSGKEDQPTLVRPLSSFDQEALFDGDAPAKGAEKKPAAAAVQKPAAVSEQVVPVPAPVPVAAPAQAPSSVPAGQKQMDTDNASASVPAVAPAAAVAPKTAPAPAQSPVPAAPSPAPAAAAPAPVPASVPAAPVPFQRSLLQIAGPSVAFVGQQFTLDIKLNDAADLSSAPFVLNYDANAVELIAVVDGPHLKKDGKGITFSSTNNAAAGNVTVLLGRTSGSGGVSGGGTLATVQFKAKKVGGANFNFKNIAFTTSTGTVLNVLPFSTAVDIRK